MPNPVPPAHYVELSIAVGGIGNYAVRHWPQVPRVGDHITLPRTNPEGTKVIQQLALATVQSVVWGASPESEYPHGRLRVLLVCEWKD